MEEELKCPQCRRLFTNPVLLPCSHTLCLPCAVNLQTPAQNPTTATDKSDQESTVSGPSSASECGSDYPDVDKVSLLSETDSGVVVNSRPNSYVGTPSLGSQFFHILQGNAISLSCPACKRMIYLDERGANCLPKNRVLEAIVDKYGESKQLTIPCQLCEDKSTAATIMCEQCEVFYCDACRDDCHPDRGALSQHNLVDPKEGKNILRTKRKTKEHKCLEHTDENLSMYCLLCKSTVCCVCSQDGRHINHDVQPLGATCKAQKVIFTCLELFSSFATIEQVPQL